MCEIYNNLSLEDLPGEIWKDIKGYEGYYQVSNMGRIKSVARERKTKGGGLYQIKESIKKQELSKRGYLRTLLSKNKNMKHFQIHRLVAQAFVSNPYNKPEVNHINEDKTDNRVENLEWMTRTENQNHGTALERMMNTKIEKGIIKKMCKPVLQYDLNGNFIREWGSTMECEKSGYNRGHVASCCRGEEKTHKGYIWKYKEEN